MSSSKHRICIDCGAELPEDGLASTCSRCLLEACFQEESVYGAPEAAGALPAGLAAPGEVFGDYELQEEIARGGMGVVFKARQRSLDRVVALKMMLPGWLSSRESVRRFRMEAEAASRLRHPGIVSIHDVGECEGQHFYSMDYIEGCDLVRRVDSKPVSPETAGRWIRSVALAIHHAHQHGILHRDLKPANILIDTQGEPHVTDFGLAKLLDDVRDLTRTGYVMGTPGFMPPEQAEPERGGVTVASDVYGLGAILYFLLTGKAPFCGSSMEHTLRLLLTEEPVAPSRHRSGIPRDLETICLKCLSKEPQRRYASAAELAEDLAAWSRHEPIRARPVPPVERLWFWARRNPWLAGVSAGLVLTIIIGALLQQVWLEDAQRAEAASEASLKLARKEKAAAEGLIQYMNEDLTDQLRPLGRLWLLDNVNRTVKRYYQGLPMKENPSDPTAGKAQFFRNNASVMRELGRLDEAQESARSAIALLQPMETAASSKPPIAAALAEAHAEMRNILAVTDPTAALSHAQETVRFSKQAYDLSSGSEETLARLANAHLELGSVLLQHKRTAEAAQEIQSAKELLTQLPSTGTNASSRQEQLALTCYYQGLLQVGLQNRAQARQRFDEYLERTKQLATQTSDPADARVLQAQAIAHGHLGQALLEMGEYDDALSHFGEYHKLAENLERLDPGNVNYRKELGLSLAWLAETQQKNNGPAEEITQLLVASREIFQKLANDFPQGDVWQDHAALAVTRLADWQSRQKQLDQARALLAEEATNRWNLLLQFASRRPHHTRFIRALDSSEILGGPPQAQASDRLPRIRDWMAKVKSEASKPGAADTWTWTEAALHVRVGWALADQQQFADTKREFELALPLWKKLAKERPNDRDALLGAARAFCTITKAGLRSGATNEAIQTVRPFVDWLKSTRITPGVSREVFQLAADLHSTLKKSPMTWSAEDAATLNELNERVAALEEPGTGQQAPAP